MGGGGRAGGRDLQGVERSSADAAGARSASNTRRRSEETHGQGSQGRKRKGQALEGGIVQGRELLGRFHPPRPLHQHAGSCCQKHPWWYGVMSRAILFLSSALALAPGGAVMQVYGWLRCWKY